MWIFIKMRKITRLGLGVTECRIFNLLRELSALGLLYQAALRSRASRSLAPLQARCSLTPQAATRDCKPEADGADILPDYLIINNFENYELRFF